MAWYDTAVFYHIYPLGLTGAPRRNPYSEPVHRLPALIPWIDHIQRLGCSALYVGPLFQSEGHGYETTDYRVVDGRLGTNADLTDLVRYCHGKGIRVILDGVFNHVGRRFAPFSDLLAKREASPYRDWFCNVNFGGDNEYHDGLSYANWGGFNLLVKLNLRNPAVRTYLFDTVRFWIETFEIDGLRLDAADVLDFEFMRDLRGLTESLKADFWLMGEVIHGEYSRWVNTRTLHSVTDYALHKALYSGHNDHNYFEIAHTVKRTRDAGLDRPGGMFLYCFADNHDVERIYTKLSDKKHFTPVHILLYTLPGIPSVYYGSEFAIEGKKERWSDDSLRPALRLEDYIGETDNACTAGIVYVGEDALKTLPPTARLIAALGHLRQQVPALSVGDYRECMLTTRQFAFCRNCPGSTAFVTVNNDPNPAVLRFAVPDGCWRGALSGQTVTVTDGMMEITLPGDGGEIWLPGDDEAVRLSGAGGMIWQPETGGASWLPEDGKAGTPEAEEESSLPDAKRPAPEETAEAICIPEGLSYEAMTVPQLQAVILSKLAANGPVTDRMRRDVEENIWHDSLVNWAKSFR